MEAYKLEQAEEEVTVLVGVGSPEEAGTQHGQLQDWELPRVLNLEKKSSEHCKWTHLKKVQHCTNLPLQITIPAHSEQGKTGPGLG